MPDFSKVLLAQKKLSYKIRGAIFSVNKNLGPGLLESIYVKALKIELELLQLNVKVEEPIDIIYHGQPLGCGFRFDLIVNDEIIIEVKSVENLLPVHHKQLLTYLKLSNKLLGILVNFNEEDIDDGIFRKLNKHYKQ